MFTWTVGMYFLALLLELASAMPHLPRASTSRTLMSPGLLPGTRSSLTQVKNPHWKSEQVSTIEVYAAPFLKHRQTMPPNLQAAWETLQSRDAPVLEKRLNGQTVAGSSGEFVWPVSIGTPAQNFYLLFDTGSGDFWVFSWEMPVSLRAGHSFYNATNSTSSGTFSPQSFDVSYAFGSAYGVVYQDTVWIDGIGVSGNPIECADNIGGAFASLPAVDGVFGLSTWQDDTESPVPQQTWLNFVLPHLSESVFTMALVQNGFGTIDFGFINSTKYAGTLMYTPVTTLASWPASGYWMFNWTGFQIGTHTFNSTVLQVLTDSGTNVCLMPQSIVLKYYSYVHGAYQQSDGSWAFPCSATLPTFTFGVGSSRLVINSSHMIFAGLADGVNCYGSIQATSESSFIYFGTPFLEALFVVHDYGGKRLGFGARTSS